MFCETLLARYIIWRKNSKYGGHYISYRVTSKLQVKKLKLQFGSNIQNIYL